MIITDDDFDGISSLKIALSHHFATNLSLLCNFLGIEVASSSNDYLLSQSKYIADLFDIDRFIENKIVDTPLEISVRYSPSDGVPLIGSTLYQIIVESLIYLSVTRPNIAHFVHVVSQFV